MKWKPLTHPDGSPIKSIPENKPMAARAGRKKICLLFRNDRYYAVRDRCPHAGGKLSAGWCEGPRIVCPLHRHSFDMESGRGLPEYGDAVKTYPVRSTPEGLYLGTGSVWDLF